jgi:pimeloyl-ACP methyl ester carboxylesterase
VTTRRLAVGRQRVMALDDVGDPAGVPLLYLHGTPDSRQARPAGDGAAARAAYGEWYARHLPNATLEVVPGAAHYLLFTRWADNLDTLSVAHGP